MFHKYFFTFWKKYKFRSLFFKNFVKILAVFFVSLVVMMFLIYKYSMIDIKSTAMKTNSDSVKMFSASVETTIRDAEYLAADILADEDISYFLALGKNARFTDEYKEALCKKLSTYMSGKMLIDSIYAYSSGSDVLCTEKKCGEISEFADREWIDELASFDDYKLVLRKPAGTSKKVFTLMKKSRTNNSVVAVNIEVYSMKKYLINKFSDKVSFYIVQSNEVLYSNLPDSERVSGAEKMILRMIKEGKDEKIVKKGSDAISISAERSQYYDLYYVSVFENESYITIVNSLFYRMIIIFFVLMIIFVAISVSLSVHNTLQIVNVLDLFENREAYNSLNESEISEIADKIISLMDDNEKLKNDVVSRNEQYEKWKMKALQTQITPHFLNNTLAVINYEVLEKYKDSENISGMISKLSKVLQYTMITEKIFVPLSEELDFIDNYADLLKLRYDNFNLILKCDESLLDCNVLRMTLQPIIENSVFHGYKDKGGTIYVTCIDADDKYIVTVEDRGTGISPERLEKLRNELTGDLLTDKNVGIKNVYKRMEAMYGDRSKFEIQSEPDRYTVVRLEIPKEI